MTEKLYYEDSHIFEFDARVLECRELGAGYGIVLDRSAFFPGGGGQASDTGLIGGVELTAVSEREGETLHVCSGPLTVGETVHCELDREQRLRRMQNHSGEHIVSGLVHRLHGFDNVGFHMGESFMTIDFDGELSDGELENIETLANKAVRDNIPVTARFPSESELKALVYRSKLELTENVRIVEIQGIDRCACCAPHVERTGEVGLIKLLDSQRHRGGVRVNLVCGMDALDECRVKQQNISAISRALSVKREDTAAAVERQLLEQQRLKERIAALSMELAGLRAAQYPETQGNICVFDNILDENALRELVNLLMEKCGGVAAAFSGSDGEGWRYIIGSRNIDLRAHGRELNALISGKGGGSSQMIQGRASETGENIVNVIKKFHV